MVLAFIALPAQHDHLVVLSFWFFLCIPHYRDDCISSTLKSRLPYCLLFFVVLSHTSAFLAGFYEFKYIIVLI